MYQNGAQSTYKPPQSWQPPEDLRGALVAGYRRPAYPAESSALLESAHLQRPILERQPQPKGQLGAYPPPPLLRQDPDTQRQFLPEQRQPPQPRTYDPPSSGVQQHRPYQSTTPAPPMSPYQYQQSPHTAPPLQHHPPQPHLQPHSHQQPQLLPQHPPPGQQHILPNPQPHVLTQHSHSLHQQQSALIGRNVEPISQPIGILQSYPPPPSTQIQQPQPLLQQQQHRPSPAVLPLPFESNQHPKPIFVQPPQVNHVGMPTTNQPYTTSFLPPTSSSPTQGFPAPPLPLSRAQELRPRQLEGSRGSSSPLQRPNSPLMDFHQLALPVPKMPPQAPQMPPPQGQLWIPEVEEKGTKRKVLDVVDPNTGSRVDIVSGGPVVAGAAPAVPLRKREPIPIVDPRSGSNVPAVPTKPRGAVPIVNPASGEAVVLAGIPEPTSNGTGGAAGAQGAAKPRGPVPIIDPASGERVIPEAAKSRGADGATPSPPTPALKAPFPVIAGDRKPSRAIPIVAPAERLLRLAQRMALPDDEEGTSQEVSPTVDAGAEGLPIPSILRAAELLEQLVPRMATLEEDPEEEEDEEGLEEELDGPPPPAPVFPVLAGLLDIPPKPLQQGSHPQPRSSSAPLSGPTHYDSGLVLLPTAEVPPHLGATLASDLRPSSPPSPAPDTAPSPSTSEEPSHAPDPAAVASSSNPSPFGSPAAPPLPTPPTLFAAPMPPPILDRPPPTKKRGHRPVKQVYTENFLRLMRDLAVPAPERLRALAEIYVSDAEDYARRSSAFSLPKSSLGRQQFASLREGPPAPQSVGGGFSNIPASWGRDAFATSSAASLLMSNSFIQDFRQAMGSKIGSVPQASASPHTEGGTAATHHQLTHRAEEPFAKALALTKEEQLLKRIVGILNRVTPEKYDTLVVKLYEGLDAAADLITKELLDKIIAQVHERALEQSNYSDMYAQLCKDICQRIQAKQAPSNSSSVLDEFRRALLNMCQERFQQGVDRGAPELVGLEPEEQEEALGREQHFRHCSKGNIRFIGELYKRSLLSERILHRVIVRLLLETDHHDIRNQDALEVLCTLLSTAGERLDHAKAETYMGHYFKTLGEISKYHHSARMKFLILDVIELRLNRWVQRKKEMRAVKLDQVERTLAEQERPRVVAATATGPPPRRAVTYAPVAPPVVLNASVPRARRPVQQQREGAVKSLTPPAAQTFRPTSAFSMTPSVLKRKPEEAPPRTPTTPSASAAPEEIPADTPPPPAPDASSSPSSASSSSSPPSARPAVEPEPGPDSAASPGRPPSDLEEPLAPESGQVDILLVEPEERLERKMGVILEEWEQCGHSEETAPLFLEEIPSEEHVAFLCSGIKFAVSANKFEKQRLQLVLLVDVLQRSGALTAAEVLSALVSAVSVMLDIELWVDVPGLWRNFSQVLIELFLRTAFGFGDLLLVCEPFLTQQQHGAGKLLLKSLMDRVKEQSSESIFDAEVATLLAQRLCQDPELQAETIEDFIRLMG